MNSQIRSLLQPFILVISILFSHLLVGQEHMQFYEKGLALYNEGKYDEALKQYESAAAVVKKNIGTVNDHYAWMISMQAGVYEITGDYALALEIRLRILDIAEEFSGKESADYALCLLTLGSHYLMASNFEKAYPTIKDANEKLINVLDPDHEVIINSLYLYALAAFRISEYEESNQIYFKALDIMNRTGQRLYLKGSILQSISSNYHFLRQFKKVDEYHKKAVSHQNSYEDALGIYTDARSAIVGDYAALLMKQRQFSDAKETLNQALEITRKVAGDRSPNYTRILGLIGEVELKSGNYKQAIKTFEKAIQIAKSNFANESLDVYSLVVSKAAAYKAIGDYVAAERGYKLAIEYSSGSYSLALSNLGTLYSDLGNSERALEYYDQIAEKFKSGYGKNSVSYALLFHNRAAVYSSQGNLSKAIEDQEFANDLLLKLEGESSENLINGLNNLSQRYFDSGQREKGLSLNYEALERVKKHLGTSHPLYAAVLNNLANNINESEELSYEKYEKVAGLYSEALNVFKKSVGSNHMDYLTTARNLASILEGLGEDAKAGSLYWESLNGMMQNMDALLLSMSEIERLKFLQQLDNMVINYRRFVIEDHKTYPDLVEKLAIVQSKMKGILFRSSDIVNEFLSENSDSEIQNTYSNWKEKNIQLAIYLQASEEERAEQNIDEVSIRREINELEKKLASEASDRSVRSVTINQVKRSLNQEEAIVDLMRVVFNNKEQDTTYAALVIRKDIEPQLITFDDGAAFEKVHIRNYRNKIRRKEKDLTSYEALWGAVAESLKGVKKVYLVPDGIYHSINVETLIDPSTQLYVGDTYRVSRVNSIASVVDSQFDRRMKVNHMALVGYPSYDFGIQTAAVQDIQPTAELRGDERFLGRDGKIAPLEGTLREVKTIKKMASKSKIETQLFTEEDATEEAVKEFRSPDILHIATHGFFLETKNTRRLRNNVWAKQNIQSLRENPMLKSGLLLAGAEMGVKGELESTNDGILTAYEASFMDLSNTKLAVLSACETGLGELSNGEGVYGLQRAFQKAGAQSVLMSLWTVSDEAAEKMMVYFYESLFDGSSIEDAFFQAKKRVQLEFPNPYDWGAFVLNQG